MNKNIGKRIQLCPFHKEKTPSMVVRSDGTYHCYGCGRKGTHDELPNSSAETQHENDRSQVSHQTEPEANPAKLPPES